MPAAPATPIMAPILLFIVSLGTVVLPRMMLLADAARGSGTCGGAGSDRVGDEPMPEREAAHRSPLLRSPDPSGWVLLLPNQYPYPCPCPYQPP